MYRNVTSLDRQHNLPEQFQPFAAHREFEIGKTGHGPARARQACHKTSPDRVRHLDKDDRDVGSFISHGDRRRCSNGNDHFGPALNDLPYDAPCTWVSRVPSPDVVDVQIASLPPAEIAEGSLEGADARRYFRIGRGQNIDDGYAPSALRRLRPCYQRPRRRAAEQRDELPPFHSITSSARESSVAGTSRPSMRAVWALMTSSTWLTARPVGPRASSP